jgi:SAM-dependent methyltransferase
MKDLFSLQAASYARNRPVYPTALYDFLFEKVPDFNCAWDCGTGNGQVAFALAGRFERVIATDISNEQLDRAKKADNITYLQSREHLPQIADDTFDLVTVGTALHWFDFDLFYAEVKRTCRPGAVIAAWCYSLMKVNPGIDALLQEFTYGTLGDYWDKERRYVEEGYRTIPFPFPEVKAPAFSIKDSWPLKRLEGYLDSWSAVQHYISAKNTNPVPALIERIKPLWQETMAVEFPLPLRIGLVEK